MKPTIDDLRRSAEFCGYNAKIITNASSRLGDWVQAQRVPRSLKWVYWNPPENAEQDRELRDAFYQRGYEIRECWSYNYLRGPKLELSGYGSVHHASIDEAYNIGLRFYYHPNDFLTLAASKLQQEKTDAAIDRAQKVGER